MSSPLIIAVPSKGRLQENAFAFFKRAGLVVTQSGGARGYRGAVKGLPGVEIAFLSASEITTRLGEGSVHLGVTGEDLLREQIEDADERLVMLTGLGFGEANVVVAVPQAWIDVRTMADLDEIASLIRVNQRRRLRVATKYINLTRRFFAGKGVSDYRIVESLGATEGAPAAGTADIVVDITTTGATLTANALKVLEDGVILESQANLVASLKADWSPEARSAAAHVLMRIAAEEEARTTRELRAIVPLTALRGADPEIEGFGASAPFGGPDSQGILTLHCAAEHVFGLADWLTQKGASHVTVRPLDYIVRKENELAKKLFGQLG